MSILQLKKVFTPIDDDSFNASDKKILGSGGFNVSLTRHIVLVSIFDESHIRKGMDWTDFL